MSSAPHLQKEAWYIHPDREVRGAAGPFYALSSRCAGCGNAVRFAPSLLLETQDPSWQDSYFVRMPQTPEEIEQACAAIEHCATSALRYGGKDPTIIRLLGNTPRHSDHVLVNGEVSFYGDESFPLLAQTARKLPQMAYPDALPASSAPSFVAHQWLVDLARHCVQREEASTNKPLQRLHGWLDEKQRWIQGQYPKGTYRQALSELYWPYAEEMSSPPPGLRRQFEEAHPLTLLIVRMACQTTLQFVYWSGFLAELHATFFAARENGIYGPKRSSKAWLPEIASWMRKYYDIARISSLLPYRKEEQDWQRTQLRIRLQQLRSTRRQFLRALQMQAQRDDPLWELRQRHLEYALFS
ncbi:MAG: ferredoxin [Myxococcales bacterium]|nr:ferredoxin [Myxococcales bacterium]